jgi:prephenate dehydrogenase
MTNRREIPTIVDEVIAEFTSLKEMIEREDETALKALIKKVRKKSEVLENR